MVFTERGWENQVSVVRGSFQRFHAEESNSSGFLGNRTFQGVVLSNFVNFVKRWQPVSLCSCCQCHCCPWFCEREIDSHLHSVQKIRQNRRAAAEGFQPPGGLALFWSGCHCCLCCVVACVGSPFGACITITFWRTQSRMLRLAL